MVKSLLILGLLVGIMFVLSHYFEGSTQEYIAPEKEVIEVEKQVDLNEKALQKRFEDAMPEIENEADAMRASFVQNKLDEIEAEFWREVAEDAVAKAIEKEKSSGVY